MTAMLLLFRSNRTPSRGSASSRQQLALMRECGSTEAGIKTAHLLRRDHKNLYTKIQVLDPDGQIVRDHEFLDGVWKSKLRRH